MKFSTSPVRSINSRRRARRSERSSPVPTISIPRTKAHSGIWDTVENAHLTAAIFDSMTVFLGFIALVTLSLGGIGVMNIMLVTVSERTREIGLRKALGATRVRIMIDFLAEGCVLAFVSGLIGWSMAFGLSSALKLVKMPEMFPRPAGQRRHYGAGLRHTNGHRASLRRCFPHGERHR